MPGYSLGKADPYRPHATGGIGHAIYIVTVTNVETGEIELLWFFGDPFEDWSVLLHRSGWLVEEPTVEDRISFSAAEIQEFMDTNEPVWSVVSGDILWSMWSPELSWDTNLERKWRMELDEGWSMELATKWDFGKVMV